MRRFRLNCTSARPTASSRRHQGTLGDANVRLATPSKPKATTQPSPSTSRGDVHKLNRVVTRLVKAAADGPNNPMWTATPDRGKRLDQELTEAATTGGASTQRRNSALEGKKQKLPTKTETEDAFPIPELHGEPSTSGIGDIRAGFFIMSQR